jgi:hypothetical protein
MLRRGSHIVVKTFWLTTKNPLGGCDVISIGNKVATDFFPGL